MINKLLPHISELLSHKKNAIIAIDGPCGAGKTTIAKELSDVFGCNVIHMDDFFLPKEQKTPERMNTPGGNFDKERFIREVLVPIRNKNDFCFRPYICKDSSFGEEINIDINKPIIVEGSYSCHPELCPYYDLRIFVNIDKDTQRQRIKKRDPDKADVFFNVWIPLEELYFSHFSIMDNCDIII